jgi:outer membrane protein OmpA-like peptidoglycan-associated protein
MAKFPKLALVVLMLQVASHASAEDFHQMVVPQHDSTAIEPDHLDQVLAAPNKKFEIDRAHAKWYVYAQPTNRALLPDEATRLADEEQSLQGDQATSGSDAVLHFAFDSTNPASWSPLVHALGKLRHSNEDISVVGHADEQGGASYNQNLSDRRADRVARYLIAHGIKADRIESLGKGKRDPLIPGDGAANRRAVIRLVSDAQEVSP